MHPSKNLRRRDLKAIESWINNVEKHQYKPKKSLEEKARKKLKLPYSVIGCGKKRMTFDLKNGLVLKVAIAMNGIKNNMKEVEIYHAVSSKMKKHLAEIKEYGHGWIIMKKIKREVPKTRWNKSKLKLVRRRFERRDIAPGDLISKRNAIRWPNIRLDSNGRIVVVDYGNFKLRER